MITSDISSQETLYSRIEAYAHAQMFHFEVVPHNCDNPGSQRCERPTKAEGRGMEYTVKMSFLQIHWRALIIGFQWLQQSIRTAMTTVRTTSMEPIVT